MFINKTPHVIRIIGNDDEVKTIFPSQGSVRLEQEMVDNGTLEDIPLFKTTFGEVKGLPEESVSQSVFYIVSKTVKDRLPERFDLVIVANTVRNSKGEIIGCRGFSL